MMKSIPLCCGILALTALVSAQAPQAPTTSSDMSTAPQSSQTTVITGCVSTDTASEPGATSRRFILSNAQLLTDGDSGQGRQAAATSYLLTNSDLSLSEHVGHKVQLTGYVDSTSSPTSSTQSMRVFHATSVRMVSATCQ